MVPNQQGKYVPEWSRKPKWLRLKKTWGRTDFQKQKKTQKTPKQTGNAAIENLSSNSVRFWPNSEDAEVSDYQENENYWPCETGKQMSSTSQKGRNSKCWNPIDGESPQSRRQQKISSVKMARPCSRQHEDTILQAGPGVQIRDKIWATRMSRTSQNQRGGPTLPFWRRKQHLPRCTPLHWPPLSCAAPSPPGWEAEGKSHRHENLTGSWISAEPVSACILPARQKETVKHLLPILWLLATSSLICLGDCQFELLKENYKFNESSINYNVCTGTITPGLDLFNSFLHIMATNI